MSPGDYRLGLLVIHNDPVPEAEAWLSRPVWTTVHTARFDTPRAPGEEFRGKSLDYLLNASGLRRSIRHLADLGVHSIGYCFASSSLFGGAQFDAEFQDVATEIAGGIPVVTSGRALREAVAERSSQRKLVVIPPWFSDETIDALKKYLSLRPGVDTTFRYELPAGWTTYERPDLFDAGARHAVNADSLIAQVALQQPDKHDVLVIPGGGMHSLGAHQLLATRYGLETISANGALVNALHSAAAHAAAIIRST
ncbi:aspartate racemase/maleate isomerase family protein [Microbacterium imperiale]|uniref:Maleate cis-trans isomerase n=1 Tax=Microbacterium imperiale TaxID=33884 RepID=A0A9W6M1P7_9MICO|nr:hypothetical protein [Microbacterium imperiale]MBP2419965.1 maleate isomerase [Microbacterium imperiale]MDS0198171.1 hypothetical protein [Microbacterium imperiale]BFE40305.1 hypothetical protein GCM10017544_12610 [Microbacterium imperiale]GLJ78718.1 hypothetical protein GCM10017586_04000 [Microbacterium imperiale]